MPGGVLQLVATASQDQYINGAPEMSYYKAVYKRHTNFAMESIRQTFNTKPLLQTSTTSVTARIGRVADMLGQVYFTFQLPDIYSDANKRFRWIQNIGEFMVYSYSARLDTQLIDQGYGEWMHVWNELTAAQEHLQVYNAMIGNTQDMYNPVSNNPRVLIRNNIMTYQFYPSATTTSAQPSISGRRIVVPLPFWFSRNPALALPLIALQYQFLEITLELRNVDELYQLYDSSTNTWVSPARYRQLTGENVSIGDFLKSPASTVDIDGYLECNFIFLDTAERTTIASQQTDLLVERVYRTEKGGTLNNDIIDMYISNPIKEFIWFARKDDINNTNNWSDFTNNNQPIMRTAKLIWNGLDRIEEKEEYYFNKIQPYQHHSNSAKNGLYCYNFGLYPEKWQPSGSFNASAVNKIQLYVTTNNGQSGYTFIVFSLYYNVFRIIGGSGGMVFAN